jgi:hypothetical protein
MKFEEAFQAMRSGKNVRRKDNFIRMNASYKHPAFVDQNNAEVILRPSDFMWDDWEIVESEV